MESGNAFNYIDGYNLTFPELRFRLANMGINKLDHITDFGYIANYYNDIMNSRDIRFISRIKNILEQDKDRANFSDLLSKKRLRNPNSERKENYDFAQPLHKEIYSSENFKNGYSQSERKYNSDLVNKYPSEDRIVKSFLDKQDNRPFIHANGNGNINYDDFVFNANNDYAKVVEGIKIKLEN